MNGTILLVEDDENDVFFMKRAMKAAQILNPLQVASDGRQAIRYLEGAGEYNDRELFPLPKLVLLDLKLPYVMGLEVLKWIREQPELKGIIVLVFSSSKMAEDIHTSYLLGANSYLVKPSDPQALTEKVKVIKDYWIDVNRCASGSAKVLQRVAS
jgi:CheY-like chemotaxis protein